eukprot:TRINITY_DN669_c0_g2_i12.p1 TRINITY_DN669_c0_g2~~TRINITY_DN669_c0_g2_i12.p1  ORF type:complete len:479 (+),score=184.05 TRINITY_DN669_c0_g2_i12:74-1510(+)
MCIRDRVSTQSTWDLQNKTQKEHHETEVQIYRLNPIYIHTHTHVYMEIETQAPTLFSAEIEELLQREKTARQNNDGNTSAKLLSQIVQTAFDLKEWNKLFQLIAILAKKRGQPKKALIDMVALCMSFINKMPDFDTKIQLIETIKAVCDKKIFLEVEYARCCLLLVKNKEDANNIEEAARILQDVQVETYGSMDRREKLEFILYQMKIMIKKNDYVRLFIISKKINRKNLEEKGIEDLKILYYSYLILYYTHENKYLDNAVCYKAILDTLIANPKLAEDVPVIDFGFRVNVNLMLENLVMYLVINTHGVEQVKVLNDLNTNYVQLLEKNEKLLTLIRAILSTEIISSNPEDWGLKDAQLFSLAIAHSDKHWSDFRKQLIQHSIRIVENYYARIHIKRLGELIKVAPDVVEDELCEMINMKLVFARIDRVEGTAVFKKRKNENEILNEWVFDINKLVDLADKTCNLISRENDLKAVETN